ncbi:hypothetical protein Pyn_37372 [Prunus yedoensis var. nudiflora]|uniref:Uncharacterized protein n=1 Tax=Prunus yedoensis var. nudiflora TaxID=2094558 RepID=A0A314ZJV1_PRUYE|nr:hypothetical protein Pyn_37372 [Prunus yedoensis var. nudiflora]
MSSIPLYIDDTLLPTHSVSQPTWSSPDSPNTAPSRPLDPGPARPSSPPATAQLLSPSSPPPIDLQSPFPFRLSCPNTHIYS